MQLGHIKMYFHKNKHKNNGYLPSWFKKIETEKPWYYPFLEMTE